MTKTASSLKALGWTHAQISRELGISMGSVCNALRRDGVESARDKRDRLTPKAIELISRGMSQAEVGKRLGVSAKTICNWLVESGASKNTRVRNGAALDESIAFGTGPTDPQTGCQEWLRCRNRAGYGQLGFGGNVLLAHRVVLSMKLGRALEPSEETRHTCDNPPCVNPDHLVAGSRQDNMNDMVTRGRSRNGSTKNKD
jgi:lambda repressor-like predicted transcriptional regulator